MISGQTNSQGPSSVGEILETGTLQEELLFLLARQAVHEVRQEVVHQSEPLLQQKLRATLSRPRKRVVISLCD